MTSGVGGSSSYEAQQANEVQQRIQQQGGLGKSAELPANTTSLAGLTQQVVAEDYGTTATNHTQETKSTKATSKKDAASGKDTVQTSKTATLQAVQGPKNTPANSYEMPSLPEPSSQVNGIQLKKNMGTLSLLGLVLTLLAQANAKSYSMDFQQQNQAIQNQVAMAPEIGAAIREQANHQSAATQAQATQSLISGITNIASFAVSAGVGIFSAAKSASSIKSASFATETADTAADATTGLTKAADTVSDAMDDITKATSKAGETVTSTVSSGAKEVMKGSTGILEKAASQADDIAGGSKGLVDDLINNPSWKDKLSRGMNVLKEQGGRAATFAGEAFTKATQVAQTMNLLSQAVDGFAGSHYGSQVAAHQKQAGIAEAQAAELQQMSSVMDKYSSQAQSLAEQAQSSINSAMQVLQNAADSMTNTSASIFH